jgi:hypothetical protein
MSTSPDRVTSVPLPADSCIVDIYPTTDLADAYAVTLPRDASDDPEQLARFVFGAQPRWAAGLMRVRDAIVSVFGLKTARQLQAVDAQAQQERVGLFRIYRREPAEILLGEDDSHLDFRLSVRCSQDASQSRQLTVSTVVQCRNRLGRVYIFLIAPFHRLIVRAALRQAARAGWPRAA